MKKVIYIVSTVIVVTLLSGCGEKATSKKNIPFTGSDIVDTTVDYAEGFFYSPSFYSLADYKKYIDEQSEEGNVPEYFMTVEKMKAFGSFVSLILLPDYEQYLYNFADKNGITFDIYANHSLSEFMKTQRDFFIPEIMPESMQPQKREDVRVFGLGNESLGWKYYVCNNIRYAFLDDQLKRIYWYANGIFISMGVDNYYEYPIDSDTFQAKLLNLDTAVDAIRENFGEPEPIEDFFNQQ